MYIPIEWESLEERRWNNISFLSASVPRVELNWKRVMSFEKQGHVDGKLAKISELAKCSDKASDEIPVTVPDRLIDGMPRSVGAAICISSGKAIFERAAWLTWALQQQNIKSTWPEAKWAYQLASSQYDGVQDARYIWTHTQPILLTLYYY